MADYLFLGGPAHGQTREVADDAPTARYIHLPDPPDFAALSGRSAPDVGAGAAVIHQYIRRELRVRDNRSGEESVRALYSHDGIPSAQHMTNELMAWLLAKWVMDGTRIIPGEVVESGGSTSSDIGA